MNIVHLIQMKINLIMNLKLKHLKNKVLIIFLNWKQNKLKMIRIILASIFTLIILKILKLVTLVQEIMKDFLHWKN